MRFDWNLSLAAENIAISFHRLKLTGVLTLGEVL